MEYEQQGFFGNIVSTNGFVAEDDQFTIYYGVSKASPCVEPMKEKREGIGGKSPTLLRAAGSPKTLPWTDLENVPAQSCG